MYLYMLQSCFCLRNINHPAMDANNMAPALVIDLMKIKTGEQQNVLKYLVSATIDSVML